MPVDLGNYFFRSLWHRQNLSSVPPGDASVMHEACIYGLDLYSSDIWCEIMGVDALKMYEYMSDIRYYHRYGYGNQLAYGTLCTMVKDFMRTVR